MKKQLVLFSTILLVSSILYGCGGQSSFNDESVSSTVSDSSEISSEDHIHTPGNAVEENRIEPTCTIDGSYDLVTYCSICHKEMLRQHFSISAPGHTPGEAVYENVINPTCVDKGSYDLVTYCLVCEEEVKRKHIEVDAKGHAPEEAKQENRIEPTCTTDGSYDSVIYCANCHEELNRTKIVLPAHGHTPEESVRENETAALCTTDGSYDLVTYCSTCHKEISREHKTTPALGHDLSEPKTYYLSDIDNQIYAEYECHRCHEYMTKELQQEEIVIELIQLDDGVNYKMIID